MAGRQSRLRPITNSASSTSLNSPGSAETSVVRDSKSRSPETEGLTVKTVQADS